MRWDIVRRELRILAIIGLVYVVLFTALVLLWLYVLPHVSWLHDRIKFRL